MSDEDAVTETKNYDSQVKDLACVFLDDLLTDEPFASRPCSEDDYERLLDRVAGAMQQAIEDECEAIRRDLEGGQTT